jgi:D-isomer specific 2-hydroxyacid dehydrogenase, NAD binding domain
VECGRRLRHDDPERVRGGWDIADCVERERGFTFHPETEYLFDDSMCDRMKWGTSLVDTAREKICDWDAVVRALENGQLAGYAGDDWYPQPPTGDSRGGPCPTRG